MPSRSGGTDFGSEGRPGGGNPGLAFAGRFGKGEGEEPVSQGNIYVQFLSFIVTMFLEGGNFGDFKCEDLRRAVFSTTLVSPKQG